MYYPDKIETNGHIKTGGQMKVLILIRWSRPVALIHRLNCFNIRGRDNLLKELIDLDFLVKM